jgi:hypothetical protein
MLVPKYKNKIFEYFIFSKFMYFIFYAKFWVETAEKACWGLPEKEKELKNRKQPYY